MVQVLAAQLPFAGAHALFRQQVARQRGRHGDPPQLAVCPHRAVQRRSLPGRCTGYNSPAGLRPASRCPVAARPAIPFQTQPVRPRQRYADPALSILCPSVISPSSVRAAASDGRNSNFPTNPGTYGYYTIEIQIFPAKRTNFYGSFYNSVKLLILSRFERLHCSGSTRRTRL